MEAPGCWHAATNWALNSAVYVLWVYCAECLGISNSLGMVCTIDCVHTILRDARPRFKTGLPDAYTYHNGVQSYYAARGFRGWLQV